jgi:hypothetical protein
MVKSKWKNSVLLLPLLYFMAWLRGTYIFVSYDWVYLIPSVLIFIAALYLTMWIIRMRAWLSSSEVGDVFLASFMIGKSRLSVMLFLSFWFVSELTPLIAYPAIYIAGVIVSFYAFLNYRKQDVIAAKDLLINDGSRCNDITCYKLLSGEGGASYSTTGNNTSLNESNEYEVVNPATGLPMIGGMGGVDTSGVPYAINTNQHHNY